VAYPLIQGIENATNMWGGGWTAGPSEVILQL